MANDQFQLGSNVNNWWDSSKTSTFHSGQRPPPSTTLNTTTESFGWPEKMAFDDSQKLQTHEYSSSNGLLTDSNFPVMGLGLTSQSIHWNQPVFRDEKVHESNQIGTMIQESDTNFQQDSGLTSSQDQWRQHKIYNIASSDDDSSVNNNTHHHQGFPLNHQPQFTSQIDSATVYVNSTINFDNQISMNYSDPSSYGTSFPDQFFRANSPPKQQLHLSNTPFWNNNVTSSAMDNVQSSFFPLIQPQIPPITIEEKKQKKNTREVRDPSTRSTKNTSNDASNKRPRTESSSPLPTSKVKKEKMADRVTALQQLVSPFGKTDTASVLSEALEYIKFLHAQVSALSTPYMRSGIHYQQNQEGPKQDLRSRGLCFVPISSTFPFNHESTVDFWTPTFGGIFR